MKLTELNLDFEVPAQEGIEMLMADMQALATMVASDGDNHVLRRAYVRATLAMVEGMIEFMKMFAHDFAADLIIPLQQHIGPVLSHCPIKLLSQRITHTELALLRDERARVKSDGAIETTTGFLDFKTNIRFAISEYCKIFTITPTFDLKHDKGWSALMSAVDIRNRIMHPKTSKTLLITDDELKTVRDGAQWTADTFGALMSSMASELPTIQAEMMNWVAEIQPLLVAEAHEFIAQSKTQIQS